MDQKNFIVAIVLSVLIIVGWQYAFPPAKPPVNQQQTASTQNGTAPQAPSGAPGTPGAPATQGTAQPGSPAAQPAQIVSRTEALARSPRVSFDTPELVGSIALKGARIDDVRLVKYRETVDPKSPPVPVLSPVGGEHPYYAEFGWSPADPSIKVPGPDTVWTASATTVAPGKPVRLTWDNGQGLIFALDISLDEFFMFDVKQSVENKTDKPVTVYPWSLVVRYGQPPAEGIYILHEGPYGVFNGSLKEFSYSDFKDNKQQKITTTGGWVGITDKYWMATLIPEQQQKVDVTLKQTGTGAELKYQIDYIAPGQAIAPGTTATTDAKLFAGAKIVRVISDYEKKYGIDKFDLTIDWGWFSFFTRPLFWLLEWLYVQLGNFGLSILILTVIVKAVFFPLANKSYAAMSKMKALQPEMEKLKERYGEDRQRMNQELMQLYRREKVNPAAGCLPIVVQIPVFFALYKVLYTTIEMRHQPFYGWIKDLSAPDPLTILTGFGLFHWQVPEFLHFFNIGIWPLIMGVTMYLQQKLNPAPTDPVQARVFQFLPILFTFMLAPFAAGLVIYWAWSNTLSIAQQYTIMRRHGTPIGGGKGKPAVATAVPAPATPAPAEGGGGGGKKGGKAKKR
jgi:YidC/Oxa1 family membrane protein insertase